MVGNGWNMTGHAVPCLVLPPLHPVAGSSSVTSAAPASSTTSVVHPESLTSNVRPVLE